MLWCVVLATWGKETPVSETTPGCELDSSMGYCVCGVFLMARGQRRPFLKRRLYQPETMRAPISETENDRNGNARLFLKRA